MAARKKIKANNYRSRWLVCDSFDDVFDRGDEDYGYKDMGSL